MQMPATSLLSRTIRANNLSSGNISTQLGQELCLDAERGHFVDELGQTEQTPCPIGTYQAEIGKTYCDDECGAFVDEEAQTDQIPCP